MVGTLCDVPHLDRPGADMTDEVSPCWRTAVIDGVRSHVPVCVASPRAYRRLVGADVFPHTCFGLLGGSAVIAEVADARIGAEDLCRVAGRGRARLGMVRAVLGELGGRVCPSAPTEVSACISAREWPRNRRRRTMAVVDVHVGSRDLPRDPSGEQDPDDRAVRMPAGVKGERDPTRAVALRPGG